MATPQSAAFLTDLQGRLAKFGLSPAGVAWATKALHPACSVETEGMPDSSYFKSARYEARGQEAITAPPGTTTTWDLLVARSAGDITPVFWSAVPSGQIFNGPGKVLGFLTTGSIAVGAAVPLLTTAGVAVGNTHAIGNTQLFTHWRTAYASLTAYMTASALNDGGTVYAGQWPSRVPGDYLAPGLTRFDGAVCCAVLRPVDPSDEDELALVNPRYYVAPARDGVYVPYRFSGPVSPFKEISTATMTSHLPSSPLPLFCDANTSPTVPIAVNQAWQAYNNACPQFQSGQSGNQERYNTVTDNSNQGWVIFRGLSPQATITIKYIQGVECVPSDVPIGTVTTSPIAMFAKAPPAYDPKAFEAYGSVISTMADCYPANWNSMGLLAASLAGAAAKLWPVLRGVAAPVWKTFKDDLFDRGAGSTMGRQQTVSTPQPGGRQRQKGALIPRVIEAPPPRKKKGSKRERELVAAKQALTAATRSVRRKRR